MSQQRLHYQTCSDVTSPSGSVQCPVSPSKSLWCTRVDCHCQTVGTLPAGPTATALAVCKSITLFLLLGLLSVLAVAFIVFSGLGGSGCFSQMDWCWRRLQRLQFLGLSQSLDLWRSFKQLKHRPAFNKISMLLQISNLHAWSRKVFSLTVYTLWLTTIGQKWVHCGRGSRWHWCCCPAPPLTSLAYTSCFIIFSTLSIFMLVSLAICRHISLGSFAIITGMRKLPYYSDVTSNSSRPLTCTIILSKTTQREPGPSLTQLVIFISSSTWALMICCGSPKRSFNIAMAES